MILVKIDRTTVRKNPDHLPFGGWRPQEPGPTTVHFTITDASLVKFTDNGPEVNLEGWKLNENYIIDSVRLDDGDFEAKLVGLGAELLGLAYIHKWPGVEITLTRDHDPQAMSFGSEPEYLYDYEPLPERITCPHCDSSFKAEHIGAEVWLDEYDRDFDKTLCPVCHEQVIEYEIFKDHAKGI